MADQALGALLGVALGDAAGAPLERAGAAGPVDAAAVAAALDLPGSGSPLLGRGQTTDDTELTICLARGLLGHPPAAGFPAESVARQYCHWYEAGAFGGGATCMTAFSVPVEADRRGWPKAGGSGSDGDSSGGRSGPSLAQRMQARAARHCVDSKANGALMRAAPLAVWGHRLPPEELAAAAAADARLSHPNPTCADASAVYCIALAHLVAHPGDAGGALAAACAWACEHAGEEVVQWVLHDSTLPLKTMAAEGGFIGQAGFVRWALTLAFHHLRRSTPAEQALRETLQFGGDTDTNAAIVLGLLGALHGASELPAGMLSTVLGYDGRPDQGGGVPRPADLRAAVLPGLATALFRQASQPG